MKIIYEFKEDQIFNQKRKLKYSNLSLEESKSVGILYRSVRLIHLKDILISNKFEAIKYGSKKCVCFSRDKNGVGRKSGDRVTFIIDGDKLSNNYKIYPYNNSGENPRYYESESRVDKDIVNLSNYIISIDITDLGTSNTNPLLDAVLTKSGFSSIDDLIKFISSFNINIVKKRDQL